MMVDQSFLCALARDSGTALEVQVGATVDGIRPHYTTLLSPLSSC